MCKPETPADEATVAEEFPDLVGMGRSADVEIFRDETQEKITDTTSNQIRGVAVTVETIQNFQCVRINSGTRNTVIPACNNTWMNARWQIRRFTMHCSFK
jgi:hypothetical protein